MRALVVDDDPLIVELMSLVLEQAGFRVERAYDGSAGLERVAEARPDVVLLDVMLPGIDGLEVTRRLHRDPATRDLPVILVSARTGEQDVEAGRAAGAADYLRKPFDPDELIAMISRVLGRA